MPTNPTGQRIGAHGGQIWSAQLIRQVPDLRQYAQSLCRDRDFADDLVQETLLRAWAGADRFEAGTNLGAWLFTILRNAFLSSRRKRSREVEDPGGEHAARLRAPHSQDAHMDHQDLERAIGKLPHDQRSALLLVAAEGLTYGDAALACGCPVGTVKSRVQRARTRLADAMGLEARAELGPDQITKAVLQCAA